MGKRKCLWCGAISDPDTILKTRDDLILKLGPIDCSAPDGDGHVWINLEKDRSEELDTKDKFS